MPTSLATGPIAQLEIAALAHETGNDAMKFTILISVAILTRAQLAKVATCFRHVFVK